MTLVRTAVDEILSILRERAEQLGVPVVWETRPNTMPERFAGPWLRPAIRHAGGGQASLTGGLGKRHWDRTGTLFVQIFVPQGSGLGLAHSIGQELLDAYEGAATPGCVWFRDARLSEVGPDGHYFQVNFLVAFTYTEVK